MPEKLTPTTHERTDPERTPEPPARALEYLETQYAALRAVLELSAEVVEPAETAIERRFQQAQELAETTRADATAQLETRFQERMATVQRAHAERAEQLDREYETAERALQETVRQSTENLAAGFQEAEREARRQREDNLLMIETVARATVRSIEEKRQAAEREVARRRKQVEALQARAHQVMQFHQCEPPETQLAPVDENDESADPAALYKDSMQAAMQQVQTLESLGMPAWAVGGGPAALLFLFNVILAGAVAALPYLNIAGLPPWYKTVPPTLAVTLLITIIVGRILRQKARRRLRARCQEEFVPAAQTLDSAARALERLFERTKDQLQRQEVAAVTRRGQEMQAARDNCDSAVARAERKRDETLQSIEASRAAQHAEIQGRRDLGRQQADEERDRHHQRQRQKLDQGLALSQQEFDREVGAGRERHRTARAALEGRWAECLARLRKLVEQTARLDPRSRVGGDDAAISDWTPPTDFTPLVPFGRLRLDLGALATSVRARPDFPADAPPEVALPALLALPVRASLFLQTGRAGREQAIAALRAVMLRLLTSQPPGRVRFTIIDPVGLGENFAEFMHLVDYEEALVGGRIWTESEQIEARLRELTNHMENVIQKYLRNEFDTIDAYNRQAGVLAEPYRFLVIADLPASFNEESVRRLSSIVASGARCGVFTLIAHDTRLPAPQELQVEDIAAASIHLIYEDERFVLQDDVLRQFKLTLDAPPPEAVLTSVMQAVGRAAKGALRVEVPFESIAPPATEYWTRDGRQEVTVPLGHTGAVRLQNLRLGRGLSQHALIAGQTGSGKSNLLHVLITNLALWYSPDEVEFYLVDFKKGVEFKAYATHAIPHARAIAIESDREFGVSVLQRIDAELARRGDLFRAAGVQDLAGYRAATGAKLPRTLLIVDEFQVFFTEDDRLSHDAAVILDRLVRQGRAFGIHVLLGSQTLGGSSGLARSTMGQMAVRIALQCSEADSQLILDDANVAARGLTRPGEAIYNDAGGLLEGNSPFQIAWLPDERRNAFLTRVSALAGARPAHREPPIVFEGNAPADIRQNRLLAGLIQAPEWPARPGPPQAWLGEPVAIKDPTGVTFHRQSGAHLLMVGQREDTALALMATTIASLCAQHPPATTRFIILDARPADAGASVADGDAPHADAGAGTAGPLRQVAGVVPHKAQFVAWRDVASVITDLAAEVRRRVQADETEAPPIFLLVYGLQRYRVLRRQDDDFSFSASRDDQPPAPDKQFAEILREGPAFGVHVAAWADTLGTVERTLDRQSIGEFGYRVLFQMSAADSSHLIDSAEANRLGLYRALLYSEEYGLLEKFRPYAPLDKSWLDEAKKRFAAKPVSRA